MTVTEILEQVKALSPEELDELTKLLIDMRGNVATNQPKTGAEIVAMLEAMPPIEMVDPHIEDPVEWVKAQRRKRVDQLNRLLGDDND